MAQASPSPITPAEHAQFVVVMKDCFSLCRGFDVDQPGIFESVGSLRAALIEAGFLTPSDLSGHWHMLAYKACSLYPCVDRDRPGIFENMENLRLAFRDAGLLQVDEEDAIADEEGSTQVDLEYRLAAASA